MGNADIPIPTNTLGSIIEVCKQQTLQCLAVKEMFQHVLNQSYPGRHSRVRLSSDPLAAQALLSTTMVKEGGSRLWAQHRKRPLIAQCLTVPPNHAQHLFETFHLHLILRQRFFYVAR